jgi:hypothetical protein
MALKHSGSKVAHPARFEFIFLVDWTAWPWLGEYRTLFVPLTSGSLKSLNKIEALAAEKFRV